MHRWKQLESEYLAKIERLELQLTDLGRRHEGDLLEMNAKSRRALSLSVQIFSSKMQIL